MPVHEPPLPVKYARQSQLKLTLPKPALYPYERTSNFSEQGPTSSVMPNNNIEHQWGLPVIPFSRPQETVAIHRGGTVLKFKLG